MVTRCHYNKVTRCHFCKNKNKKERKKRELNNGKKLKYRGEEHADRTILQTS